MITKKSLLISLGIFTAVYLFLILPAFKMGESYASFYRNQGFRFFNNFGEKGFVVFEGHEDTGADDTRVYQTNKSLADEKGNVVSVPFNISTRILAYLPTALLLALFAATPIKPLKRLLLIGLSQLILQALLMLFLYILLLDKYIKTPRLELYQDFSAGTKKFISFLNDTINHGMGLNNFLVILIWILLLFFFEKNLLSAFMSKLEKKVLS